MIYIIAALAVLYLLSLVVAKMRGPKNLKQSKNILFVTAHPDDECMFFAPAIEYLKQNSNLFLLVLSNGGYDGLGK